MAHRFSDSTAMTAAPLFLDNNAVRRLLSLDACLPAIEQALIELSAGRVTQPLRTVFELPNRAACCSSSRRWLATRWRPS
jgi:ornithine cyclodeaminase/alanine dehydrogenase-like protein (mu-crystallin family)